MATLLWTQKRDFGPKARVGHAMAFDDTRGHVVLFGGYDFHNSYFGDTWEWDGEYWTQMADTGPSSRSGHAMAFDIDRQQTILFGGRGSSGLGMAETWIWDGENWTQLADGGPPGRAGHVVASDINRKRVVLFGGAAEDNHFLSDTWEWDGVEWTQMAETGPSARAKPSMAYDHARARIVLFGGGSGLPGGKRLGDTWEWTGQAWIKTAEFGATPCSDAAMAFDGKGVAMFGGVDSTIAAPTTPVFGSTWEWDGKHWTERQDIGPSPRWYHAMAYDSRRQRMVLFGGVPIYSSDYAELASRLLGDTWEHSEAA